MEAFITVSTVLFYMLVVGLLAAASYIDIKTHEIPNKLNLALLACGVLSILLMPHISLTSHLIGLFCVSVPMLAVSLLFPDAVGMGDVKLMGACGLLLGWEQILVAAVIGILVGGLQGVYFLLSKKKGRKDHFAFGPALCIGIVTALFAGRYLFDGYLFLFMN